MSLTETRESNSISMREHEVEALREKLKEMQAELSDLRERLSSVESNCVLCSKRGDLDDLD